MLRNISRAVTTKQSLMADHSSLPSPPQSQTAPNPSFLASPRFFNGFLTRTGSDAESVMSPTSTLDGKSFSNFSNPFGYDRNISKPTTTSPLLEKKQSLEKLDSEGVGLAFIDSLNEDRRDANFSKPDSRMVLFGAKLKVQIPPLPASVLSPLDSPKSPGDFGIKTRNPQFLGSLSPFPSLNSGIQGADFTQASEGRLSFSEMELSEDYTCVITRGPNPKTTHIFDNCIVETCCGVAKLSELKKEDNSTSMEVNFLGFCHSCKNSLGEGKDIYMYRGEKVFCSNECRCQEMLFEGAERSDAEDTVRN